MEEKKNNEKPISKTNNKPTNNRLRKSEDKNTKSNPPRGAKIQEKRNPEPAYKPRARKALLIKAKEVPQTFARKNWCCPWSKYFVEMEDVYEIHFVWFGRIPGCMRDVNLKH